MHIVVVRYGPRVSHLLFADDSLLLSHATVSNCQQILHILDLYEHASGQKINREKTSLYFSANTPYAIKGEICSIVGVQASTPTQKYLGLLVMVGKSKHKSFSSIKERVIKKIMGWKEKFLSRAGQ